MQKLYDAGIYTGWALVVEMIERGDHASLESLADSLRSRYQNQAIDDRMQLVINHAGAMYRTLNLPKNAAKGGWQDMTPYDLVAKLQEEVGELIGAAWGWQLHGRPVERVESEAADVSNVAAMIVDVCRRRQRP